jgi:coenzyme Q-binding protein COQ10
MKEVIVSTVSSDTKKIFETILEIGSYPCFLPYCSKAAVLKKQQIENNIELLAELFINYKGVKSNYLSNVSAIIGDDKTPWKIFITSNSKIFKKLDCIWVLEEQDAFSTKVKLEVTLEFKNKLFNLFMKSAAAKKIIQDIFLAFYNRVINF